MWGKRNGEHPPRKPSIARTILLYSNISVIILVAILGYFWVYREYARSRMMLESFKSQLFQSQKDFLRSEVETITEYVRHKRSQAELRIQTDIRTRVEAAYDMAMNFYRLNRDAMPKARLKALVIESLRHLRFNNGRGYYFIDSMDGTVHLFPDRPDLEKKNLLDMRDTKGKSVIRDMVHIAREQGEGFYEYTWTKPGMSGTGFPKIAFIKYIAPFDMFIGTGEYLDNMEKDLQGEALEWITKIHFGNDGYVFVQSMDTLTFLAHPQKELIGRKSADFTSSYDVEIGHRLVEASRHPGGGYVTYQWNKPSLNRRVLKISYVKAFPEWNWIIVTGVYMDDVEQMLAMKTSEFQDRTRKQVLFVGLLIMGMVLVSLLYNRFYSRRIQYGVDTFTDFSKKAAISYEKINPQAFTFSEFVTMGEYVNKMVDDFRSSQQEIKSEKDQAQMYLDTAAVMFVALDLGGHVTLINRKGCKILGGTEEEILGKNWIDTFIPENQRSRFSRIMKELAAGTAELSVLWGEYAVVTLQGSERLIAWNGTILRNREGAVSGILGAGEDVTERRQAEMQTKKLENQLVQAQKMEAIGILAGGVAHDFNNILSAIVGYASLLQMKFKGDKKLEEYIELIIAATERAVTLTHSLLAFSRKQETELEPVEINRAISGFHKILTRMISEDIDFHLDLADQDLMVEVDVRQFEQVLMNLATNSRDAMPGGGVLTIATSSMVLEEAAGEIPPGSYAVIAICDTGSGMDERTQAHLFEPFFTTKEVGKGTGLGLAIAYGIIKKHDGYISVNSAIGQGTIFRIFLPLKSTAREKKLRWATEKMIAGTETILLIEDDAAVRQVTRSILVEFGYSVIEAADGEEAVATFAREQDRVQLILCDLVMPKKNGRETIAEIRQVKPDVKVIFISGYAADIIAHQENMDSAIPLLLKPLKPAELLAKVRQFLDS